MPNHLSILGIIHTAISVLAVLIAFYGLLRYGKLNPMEGAGRLYTVLTVIACLTALPIMKTGHPTPGHPLAVIILLLLPIAIYAYAIKPLKKVSEYVQTIIMSFTLFLSMIPATVETLTRLPISHPLATDPASPIIKMCLTIIFVMFVAGTTYQVIKIKAKKKSLSAPEPGMG